MKNILYTLWKKIPPQIMLCLYNENKIHFVWMVKKLPNKICCVESAPLRFLYFFLPLGPITSQTPIHSSFSPFFPSSTRDKIHDWGFFYPILVLKHGGFVTKRGITHSPHPLLSSSHVSVVQLAHFKLHLSWKIMKWDDNWKILLRSKNGTTFNWKYFLKGHNFIIFRFN